MTDKLILEKALVLFNEKGYEKIGMREIARELGISPGNLTYYFKKKIDILIALMEQFSADNSALYEEYFSSPPSVARFLALIKAVFISQIRYRGVYIGNQFIQEEVRLRDRFGYKTIAANRAATFKKIFTSLRAAGQLDTDDEGIDFLVSYMTLFGRFWISEAALFHQSPDTAQAIRHYLTMLVKLLSLFATEAGLESMEKFKSELAG